MTTSDYAFDRALQKSEIPTRKKLKAKRGRTEAQVKRDVRAYCFGRERNIDRVTRFLPAESLHELRFKSLGGKVSRKNSVAVQGDGVRGTHGFLQRNEISYRFEDEALGAEGTVIFTVHTLAAADHCRVNIGDSIVSPVMKATEVEW